MGFTEILLIGIVAIIFLGPDKLPTAMVQIAKTFNSFKKSITDVRSTFEAEINMHDLREDALSYKRSVANDISGFKNAMVETTRGLDEMLLDDELIEEDTEEFEDFELEKKTKKKSGKNKEKQETAKKTKKKSKAKTKKKKSDPKKAEK